MSTAVLPESTTPILDHVRGESDDCWHGRFHAMMAIGTVGALLISWLGHLFCNLTLALDQAVPLALMMTVLIAVAAQYRYRQEHGCFNIVMMTFWIVVITNLHFFPMYMAAGCDVPMSDAVLAKLDRAVMGFEVPDVLAALQPYPRLNSIMLSIYGSLLPLMTLATIVPPMFHRMEKAKEYAIACVVAASISLPIFACFQAVGPWHHYNFEPAIPSLAGKEAMLQMLKTDGVFLIDVTNRDGLITFPSFHVILTVLAAVALWPFRYLRWVTTIWAVLIIASTVTTGIHYGVDVLGGLGVAFISWLAARAYLTWESRTASAASEAAAV